MTGVQTCALPISVDAGDLTALALLDLSVAFDTVDHTTLLRRLDISYAIRGRALKWFHSYLGGHCQFVRRGVLKSAMKCVLFGVPQGSVLGSILFLLYTADLLRLIEQHGLHPHLMPMIHKSTALAHHLQHINCRNGSLNVQIMSHYGCAVTVCS